MKNEKQDWFKVEDIATRTDIPKHYLRKIVHALGKTGLFKTKRGHHGGVALARPANQITLLDIATAVQGEKWMDRCLLGLAGCSDERNCPVHEFWSVKKEIIRESMKQITLDQVAVFESKPGGRLKSIEEIQKDLNERMGIKPS
jgi:Rrf2 family iron-sulfur cluster assembly transcriptional regulator